MSMAMKVARNTPGRAMPGTGYRGDPGLLGFLGRVGKTIAGGISGFARGGPTGALGGAIRAFKGGKPRGRAPIGAPFPVSQAGAFNPPFGGRPGVGITLPFGGRPRVSFGEQMTVNGGPPGMGYRLNKSDYFVKADPLDPNSPGVFVPKESRWVKIRHRNPLNPRALSKAIGRVGSAKKATTMLGRITIRKAC